MGVDSHYINLKEVFKGDIQKVRVNPQKIRKVLIDLKMDEEEEITIYGTFGDWGWFCNYLLSRIWESTVDESEE